MDPKGKNIKPVAITNFTDYVTSELKTEMDGYVTSLGLLVKSAQKGIEFGKSEDPTNPGNGISQVLLNYDIGLKDLNKVKDNFMRKFGSLVSYLSLATGYFFLGSFVCIGIGLFVLLISVGSIIIFSCRMKDKCHFFSCITNACNFLLSISNFILVLVGLSFIAVNFSLASLCDFSFELMNNPSVSDEIKIYFEDSLKGFLNSGCYDSKGLNLTEYIPINDPGVVDNLNEISTFLNGFSHFDNFKRIMSADRFDNGIVDISAKWEVFRQGMEDNFYDVAEELNQLNQMTGPCNEVWVLNTQKCDSKSNLKCKDLLSTRTFDKDRDCLSQPLETQEKFDLLRNSFVSQSSLMKKMIETFDDITSDTAHAKVKVTSTRKCGRR